MSFLHDKVLNDDFIWDVITSHIPPSRRQGSGALKIKMNCPMCEQRGYTADTRQRFGIFREATGIGMWCFNCTFRTRFAVGRKLPSNLEKFLEAIGVPEREVKEIKLRAFQVSRFVEKISETQPEFHPFFQAITLPEGARTIQEWTALDCQDANFLEVVDYLLSRGDVVATAIPYYWTPIPITKENPETHLTKEHQMNRTLIIPCLHDDTLIGWVGRNIDGGKQKYYKQTPNNLLFNSKALNHPYRKYVCIMEGYFDALAIDGIAAGGVSLNDRQISWINQSGKTPVVVPDRDKAGMALAELAITQGWAVAMPNFGGRSWWNDDIKDVDEAVKRHGRLYTIQSIIASISNDAVKIRQRGLFPFKGTTK